MEAVVSIDILSYTFRWKDKKIEVFDQGLYLDKIEGTFETYDKAYAASVKYLEEIRAELMAYELEDTDALQFQNFSVLPEAIVVLSDKVGRLENELKEHTHQVSVSPAGHSVSILPVNYRDPRIKHMSFKEGD